MSDQNRDPDPLPVSPQTGEFDAIIPALTKDELGRILRTLQGKLGTVDEGHDDLLRAQAIAHRISNLETGEQIAQELESESNPMRQDLGNADSPNRS